MASAGHFNPARMNEIADQAGSQAIVYELVGLFVEDVNVRMGELASAVTSGDAVLRERVAHSIKGSCANLGAERMAGMAHAIERCPASEAPERFAALQSEFDALCQTLRQRYP